MSKPFEEELPQALWFDPHFIADPVPWWWLRHQPIDVQRETMVIRVQAIQQMHEVQAAALGKTIELLTKSSG